MEIIDTKMGTSVIHIKTEIECKVFLFDEEKGIATPDKYFNLEVRKGEQDLIFVSTSNQNSQFHTTYFVEDNDCDYKLFVLRSSFETYLYESSQEAFLNIDIEETPSFKEINNGVEDEFGVVYSKDGTQLLRCCNYNIDKYSVRKGCKVIRSMAFFHCFNLAKITLPIGLTHIGRLAFGQCNFKDILLPDSLQYIGSRAFDACKNLSTFIIPISITHIGHLAFWHTNINNIVCNSPNFAFEKGWLINLNSNEIVEFLSEDPNVVVPNGFTHIGARAFFGCNNITSVTLPSSITHIGDFAFSQCDNLSNVSMPVNLIHIGDGAFAFCNKLSNIDLPNSISHIGKAAFRSCESLMKIVLPQGLERISENMFEGCWYLTEVVLPKKLTSTGKSSFYSCHWLSNITFPSGLTSIEDEAFSGCVNLPIMVFPEDLTFLGNKAFDNCRTMKKINLPSSLNQIGSSCFIGTKIREVICDSPHFVFDNGCLIDVKEKKLLAFFSDKEVVVLPNGITRIGADAFENRHKLSRITFPPTLTHIEKRAFVSCRKLSEITFSNGLQQIDDLAFSLCEKLYKVELPEGLTYIGDKAFIFCHSLIHIVLPASITHIGAKVFDDCENLTIIQIPKGTRSHFEELLPCELHDKLNDGFAFSSIIEKLKDAKSYYIFFDTETTGVPKNYNAPASNTKNWPRLVQLGWILTDESGNEISSGNEIVKPEGFVIPADASRVHGITTEVALREGKSLRQVLQSFLKDAEGIKCFVGHNVSFDQKVVGAELYRLGITDTVSTRRSLDTMIAATDYCKIPGTYGYKWPKLIELHRKLFGCDFEAAHDAMADITATKKCFFEMKRRGLI